MSKERRSPTKRLRVLAILALSTTVALYSLFLHDVSEPPRYYSLEEPFGPLSRASTLIPYVVAVSILVLLARFSTSVTSALAVIVIAVAVKYLLPQFFDSTYTQNFYDAEGHMQRGAYVTITGHSDPKVDAYFDVQPGFFWWTAVYVNVVFGPQRTLASPPFEFFIKWFNILILMIYLPILAHLFKKLRLKLIEILLGYTVFVFISLSRFHYSAQAFSWALYWLLFAECINALTREEMPPGSYIFAAVLASSLVFIHQGTTLFALIIPFSLIASFVLNYLKKSPITHNHCRKYLFFSLTFLALLWFVYLMYITIYTFKDFVRTLNNVLRIILREGLINITVKATVRPYEVWQIIVRVKSIYMIVVVVTSMLIYFLRFLKGNELEGPLLIFMVFFSATIGSIALALGGAGYVERVFEAASPLVISSLLTTSRDVVSLIDKRKRMLRILGHVTLLVVPCIMGSVLYFSGWNFQSIAYSDWKAGFYLRAALPNVAGIYFPPTVCIRSLYYPHYPYKETSSGTCLYIERFHNNIQAVYYLLGDFRYVEAARFKIKNKFNVLYSSPTVLMYQG